MKLVRLGLSAATMLCASGAPSSQTRLPVWTADGNQANAWFGAAVASAGDVNRDGYDDVIVGAEGHDHGETDEGRAYLYLGSKEGVAKLPAWTAESNQAYSRFGSDVASAGDVDGDGFGDVIVGSYWYSHGQYLEGVAFVYHGSPTGLGPSPAWSAEGNEQAAYFGSVVASAGDVNGDGYGDVLVGALFLDLAHTPQGEGAVFVYLGSAAGLSTSPAWSAHGNQGNSGFGGALCAGDVNGDGYDDVVVGAQEFNNPQRNEGRAFVYLGSAAGLAASPAWTAEGNQAFAELGASVAAGDVDGDGYDDVVVGSPFLSGRILVYRGSSGGLSIAPDWIVEGTQGGSLFGSRADTGDLDGDGYADVIVGAPFHNHPQQDEGRVFAFFGSALGLGTRTSWTAEADQPFCSFGYSVAAGDVDGDGFGDVLAGALEFDAGQRDEGRAFAYLGSSRHRLR